MKKSPVLAALLCALAPLAYAADETMLDEVVVTTTRIEQPLKQTLSSTTVITQEDIKNSQASDLTTILRTVAGIEISQNGGTGKASDIFLRGSNSTQALVLLDGVRINSATLGTTPIEHLMLDQIERIEIVRGNVSSLYGSEAIGGVVQIFTKRSHGEPTFNASIGKGTHNTQRTALGVGNKLDNTEFSLNFSKFSSDGVSSLDTAIKPNANPDNDGYDNTSVSANVRHTFNTDNNLTATAFNSSGHSQYDSNYGLATDINNNDFTINKYSLASDNRLSEAWKSKIQLSQGMDSYQDFKNGAPVVYGSIYKTTNRLASWQNTIQLDTGKQLLAGVEYLGQEVYTDSPSAYLQDKRKVNSLFAGYTGNYGPHQLQTNIRQDNNSQYGAANTGLLGYGYALTDTWRATTSYSTAFRAPTFNELYYPGYGNTDIRPEKSRSIEAGVHYSADATMLDIVYFDNRTNDLINAVLVDPATFTYQAQNISEARIDGLEFSYSAQLGDTGLKSAVTIQNPRDLTNNKALSRRAMTHANLGATHRLGALQIGAEWLYSDTRPDGAKTLPEYHVFNLTAAYALNKQMKLALRADNLTDQNDSNAYGYNPLGRTFFASLSYQQ